MFCTVKNEKPSVNADCSNDIRILRLVTSFVHFAWMLDLVHNIALDGGNVTGLSVATDLSTILIIVLWVWCHMLRNLHICDLQEIRAVIRSMGTEQQAIDLVVLALRFLHVRKPLNGQSWPCQGSTFV